MLDEVISDYKPRTWTNMSYNNRRYALLPVTPYSAEYRAVTAQFWKYRIESVERVQHPYALGYFMFRQKQLLYRGQRIYEDRRYHYVSSHDKDVALEYNLDVRKYTATSIGNDEQSKPKFYKNVDSLWYNTIIVCKVLVNESSVNASVVAPLYESEYMPEYVIKLFSN